MATYVQVVPTLGDAQVRLGQIQRGHLSYLHLDEGTEKLRARRDLEAIVGDHLCSVPHREKFTCPNFGDVLRRTIDERPDFKASGAAQAFDALERYALNLIAQPWRQEYLSVRLYSGFFKHSVEYYLSNVEEILYLMGYEPADGMEVRLNEPVDPDRVTDIALNCLIAAVECQIMMQILETVGGSYSWKEISRVRRHSVGGSEKTSEILLRGGGKLSKSNKVTADGVQHGGGGRRSNGFVRVEKLVDVPDMWTDGVTDSPMEADERYPAACLAYGGSSSWERKSVSNGGGFHQRRPIPSVSYGENFEGALSLMHEDRRRSLQFDEDSSQTRADCWGFVDQSLERKGYNKDYGERGDLLKNSTTAMIKNKNPPPDPVAPIGHSPLSDYRNAQPTSYATQKRPKMSQYGRLPAYAKPSAFYGTRGIASTVDDLIELDNPSSNLGFHPGMLSDPLLRAMKVSYNPSAAVHPPPLPPPAPAQHYYPLYAALLHPSSTATLPSNFFSSIDRQRSMDLLAAIPPPPPPVKHSSPQDVIDALRKMQLAEDGLLPLVTGGTRDRRSKKSQASAEQRCSTYDNFQDVPDVSPASISFPAVATTPSSINNPVSPPSPTPPPLFSANEKRSVNGSGTTTIRDMSVQRIIKADKAIACSRDVESDRLEVPSSRRSSQSSSSTTRDQRGSSSGRESVEKSRMSSSSSKPRHERSASVGSTRSSSGAKSSESSWECWACTYLNSAVRDVCEMCSRSRCKGAESAPLSRGGHECQNCTLVNAKGARKCSACGCNLENSPTYV